MTFPSRLAVIADVHGNARALEAVLADIRRRGVTRIVNLGDNANGPLDPAKCVALLREHVTVNVRGNGGTAFHATPASDTDYLFEEVTAGGNCGWRTGASWSIRAVSAAGV